MTTQPVSTNIKNADPIVLVCAADNNYAMPLAVMLRSVLENLGDKRKLSLFIIDGGIEENNKCKIEKSICSDNRVLIKWLQPSNSLLADVGELPHYYTKAIYHRLCIPEVLTQYKKAVYLDSDLIVLGDIGKLWDINFGGHFILAARDLFTPPLLTPGYSSYLKSTNSTISKMFNSGVLVIDLEKWRTERITIRVIEYISQFKLLDQEALNIVLKDKWKEIDPRWNQTTGAYSYSSWESSPFSKNEFDNLLNNPEVIHFTSASKPWNSINGHPAQPIFYSYLDMTAWSGWRFTQLKRLLKRLMREVDIVQRHLSFKHKP